MPLVEVRALILHAFPYGDTSRILRILTPEYGLRSVIAKGAQRPRSRFGGILEPFTEGLAQFNLREGKDLFTLSGFTLIRPRQPIGRDLTVFAGASLIAELVLRTGTEEPDPELFATLSAALDSLASGPSDPVTATLAAIWHLVGRLGFQPQMDRCIRCGRNFVDDEPSRFDVHAGGAVCQSCRPSGRLIPAAIRSDIAAMSAGIDLSRITAPGSMHRALLGAFVASHIALGRPLRSLPLFLDRLA